ncbi:hypothetical protein [Sphingobacterium siyangense]|uniref:hypothetical protein n=1 Tax=Sphingobacterium siyangense TaxID=459529 RepID=UPI003016B87D
MIRGSQTIASIFPTAIDPQESKKLRKGVYTEDRDICLCYRYYYHFEIIRNRPDDVLASMEKEFFISASTIMARLVDCSDLLKDIVNNKPTRTMLKKKYPWFSWN